MTENERQILQNLADNSGHLPARPLLNRPEAVGLMRLGWIEAVKPKPEDHPGRAVPVPYVLITDAGREALSH